MIGGIFIASMSVFFTGIYAGNGEFRGWPAVLSFFGMCSTGLALAVHSL